MSLRADISYARNCSPRDLRIVAEALAWLAILRLATLTLPFRRVAPILGLTLVTPVDVAEDPVDGNGRTERIGWAVRAAAARTPWTSTCLVQSLAGFVMLRRRHLRSTVYLGVAKDGRTGFAAHSWLQCGDRVLTGDGALRSFSVIAAYG